VKTTAAIGNLGWFAASMPEYRRYRRDAHRVEQVQRSRLTWYLERNAGTAFGQDHGFACVSSWEEFVDRVPVQRYEDIEPYVSRIAAGEANVLTADPVRLFEPSSGSAGPAKWIPYTRTMQQEVRRAVALWVTALFRSRPDLLPGPAYWSLTPQLTTAGARRSAVPVGFDDDSAYLGGLAERLIRHTMVTHAGLRELTDADRFFDATLLLLLKAAELRLFSVWHPSYLDLLLRRMQDNWSALLDLVGSGVRDGTHGIAIDGDPARARQLERIGGPDPRQVWPHLGLISCWTDGHAASYLPRIRELFPGVAIQGKGLVATEAFVTVPVGRLRPLAIRSHVFEFLNEDGKVLAPWQLDMGERYAVLVSTGGGLCRYRLGDRVEVDGFFEDVPSLRFVGREDQVSDYFGEKLSEAFVTSALHALVAATGVTPSFSLLAVDQRVAPAAYTLYAETRREWPGSAAALLEAELRRNPHYDYCRRIGQLGPVRIMRVGPGAYDRYAGRLQENGMRLGDIKPASLSALSHWQDWFLERRSP